MVCTCFDDYGICVRNLLTTVCSDDVRERARENESEQEWQGLSGLFLECLPNVSVTDEVYNTTLIAASMFECFGLLTHVHQSRRHESFMA